MIVFRVKVLYNYRRFPSIEIIDNRLIEKRVFKAFFYRLLITEEEGNNSNRGEGVDVYYR
jgi:hypothetical protein